MMGLFEPLKYVNFLFIYNFFLNKTTSREYMQILFKNLK